MAPQPERWDDLWNLVEVYRTGESGRVTVAGETVFRAAITTEDFVDYGLTLSPTGRVALLRDGAELAALELGPGLALRAALYGRTSNEPGSGDVGLNTRVASASVSQQRCDMPGALALRPTPALGGAECFWGPLANKKISASSVDSRRPAFL